MAIRLTCPYCLKKTEGEILDLGAAPHAACQHCAADIGINPAFDREVITQKAWDLYSSPEKEKIADYTKYDALADVVQDLEFEYETWISDEEYAWLVDAMECL